ncbi:MAG TPA: hypothetical protein VN285_06900 [Candidatus Deferrimicrobium sp.]|nr:hypothetical protein [Candidatus Deferrimicrobium sp.]
MPEDVAIRKHVDDLFRYLDTYEKSYGQFETEAFLQTYHGICAVFQALRQQRDKAVSVDEYLLDKIKLSPLTSSDLRQAAVQVLITFFESEADIDGLSNRSYTYCRGLRAVKQDAPFFEGHLVPVLFRDGSLNNNSRLNSFLLHEIARFLNTFGKGLKADLSPEPFAALSDPLKILELARRRQQLGTDLLKDRTSLEFHLQRIDAFGKLRQKSRLCEFYLKEWHYLAEKSFWSKIKAALGEVGGKFRGAFSSSRYFRLVITQRNPAYAYYVFIILLFVALAVYVPIKWNDYASHRLDEFQKRTVQTPGGGR